MSVQIKKNYLLTQADLNNVFDKVGVLWEYFRDENIFLTGGTGFLGKWILETILYANYQLNLNCNITVLSRRPKSFVMRFPHLCNSPNITLQEGDVRNFEFPEGKFTFVIHAATDVIAPLGALDTFSTCIDGTKHVLDFARNVNASDFLLVSSGAVYGEQPSDLVAIPETYCGSPDTLNVKSAYGEGKRGSEWLANAYATEFGLNVKVARCFSFVGPYLPLDKHFAIGNFVNDCLNKRAIIVGGDGTPLRSYMYASDSIIWLITILIKGRSGEAYNVGSNEAISIVDLAHKVVESNSEYVDIKIMQKSTIGQKTLRYIPSIVKSKVELGLEINVSVESALNKTFEFYRRLGSKYDNQSN